MTGVLTIYGCGGSREGWWGGNQEKRQGGLR